MQPQFQLDSQLENDLRHLGEFELCQARLLPSEFNPWVVLIPKRDGIFEWHHLQPGEQQQLQRELCLVSTALEELFSPTTLNVGALGNIVRQFHLHVVARFDSDPNWPGPVWGGPTGEDESKIYTIQSALLERLFPQVS